MFDYSRMRCPFVTIHKGVILDKREARGCRFLNNRRIKLFSAKSHTRLRHCPLQCP